MRRQVPKKRKNRGMKLHLPVAWRDDVAAYALYLRSAGKSEETVATRLAHVSRMSRELGPDPWSVTGEELVAWAGTQSWQIETRRSYRQSARSFWRWATATGRAGEDITLVWPHVPAAKPRPRPAPDRIYRGALARATARVRLMLRLGAELGLRRAEVARIHVGADLYQDGGLWYLVVHGKGGKTRVMPIPDDIALLISAGPERHTPGCGYSRTGWLFPGQDCGHLSPRWVGTLCADALQAVQQEDEDPWTLHKLRHRFATRAYRVTRNIRAVQEALGHASVATTQIYTAVDSDEVRAAVMAAA